MFSLNLLFAEIEAFWLARNGHMTWRDQSECFNSSTEWVEAEFKFVGSDQWSQFLMKSDWSADFSATKLDFNVEIIFLRLSQQKLMLRSVGVNT